MEGGREGLENRRRNGGTGRVEWQQRHTPLMEEVASELKEGEVKECKRGGSRKLVISAGI